MGWVDSRWTDEINEVTGTSEYQNAIINICDPSLVTTSWDIDTNTPTVTGSAVLVRGIPARVNWPLRAISDPGTGIADPSTVRAGRLTIQYADYPHAIRNGMVFVVTNGGDNPDLVRYVFRIDEALNSSNMASRVMKISVNAESAMDSAYDAAYL